MYRCLAITFRNGGTAVVPIPKEDKNRLLGLVKDMDEKCGFIELRTIFDQPVWLNLAQVSRIAFLVEDTNLLPFETQGTEASALDPKSEVDLDDVELNVHVWTGAERTPFEVQSISGHDWMEITTSCESKERFFVVTDESGEQLAVAVSDVNMFIGTETARYSEAMLETVYREMFANSGTMPE